MVKSSKAQKGQIEQDEKKLLYEITRNTKMNLDTIAKNCGFSRQKASRMMKQLEEKNLFWGYTPVFDEQKIGQEHFLLLIKRTMEKMDEKIVDRIVSTETETLAKKIGVFIETSAYLHGEYDWILTFTADDLKQAKYFSERLISMYPSGTRSITLLQTLFFVRKNNVLNPERQKLKEFL